MRSIIERANLRGTIEWLQKNDEYFGALDEAAATAELTSKISRKFKDLSLERADSDQVHETVWRGVLAVVGGGASVSHAADQREVVLYVAPTSRSQPNPFVELD